MTPRDRAIQAWRDFQTGMTSPRHAVEYALGAYLDALIEEAEQTPDAIDQITITAWLRTLKDSS